MGTWIRKVILTVALISMPVIVVGCALSQEEIDQISSKIELATANTAEKQIAKLLEKEAEKRKEEREKEITARRVVLEASGLAPEEVEKKISDALAKAEIDFMKELEAVKVVAKAAGEEAGKLGKKIAEKALPEASDEKKSKTEGTLLSIGMGILTMLAGGGRRI